MHAIGTAGLLSEPSLAERLGLVRPSSPEEAHAPAMARGAECKSCPLYGAHRGPVLGQVVPGSPLAVVGEAPGKWEVENGRVFDGWSGDRLDEGLLAGGLPREQATVVNVLGCFPPDSFESFVSACVKAGLRSPVEACWPMLERNLADSGSKTWLAVGGQALRALARLAGIRYGMPTRPRRDAEAGDDMETNETLDGEATPVAYALSIKRQHGAPIPLDDGRILCSSLHPAFASRGARSWLRWISGEDGAIARAARIALRGTIDWSDPPNAIVFPSIEEVEAMSRELVAEHPMLTIDVETDSADAQTARLRLVGLRARLQRGETAIAIPYRWRDGRWYWPDARTTDRARTALIESLSACQWNMHNGAFDTAVLRREGLWLPEWSRKCWFDTMLAENSCGRNDLPKDLGSTAVRYFEVRLWKKDVDHKASIGVDVDRDLHRYNINDTTAQGRVQEAQLAELGRYQGWNAFTVDTALAPVFRDMGALGLFVDEPRRAELSARYGRECESLLARLRDLAGRPSLNPRSPVQMQSWLFGDLKLLPTLATDGRPWEEGEAPSTGMPSVVAILNRGGLSASTREALEAYVRYKSADKVRSTYVDGLPVRPWRPGIGRVACVYKQHVTPSGRTSSSPNVQNIPSRAWGGINLHEMFVAPPGHVIVETDMRQIELRIYAKRANDRLLLKAFAEGLDPHTLAWAQLVSDERNPSERSLMTLYERFTKMKKGLASEQALIKHWRRIAKEFEYGVIYGIEAQALFDHMTSSRDKATGEQSFPGLLRSDVDAWFARWHLHHPETKAFGDRIDASVAECLYAEEPIHGRRRWFLGGLDKKNAARNHPIQGEAAAYKNTALLRFDEQIPHGCWSSETGLFFDGHDAIGAYVPAGKADEARRVMTESTTFDLDGLTIDADEPTASERWH